MTGAFLKRLSTKPMVRKIYKLNSLTIGTNESQPVLSIVPSAQCRYSDVFHRA